jgi:hypothetical protein
LSGTETLSNFANSSTSCNQALTTVEKEILALSLNNPISGFTESQLLYASDISDSFKTQARTALNDAAAVFGFYDLNYFGIGSSVSAYESDIKSQFCAVLGLATCTNAGTMAYLYDIANGGSPEDAGANVPGFTTDAYSNPPKKTFSIYQGLNTDANIETTAIHEYVHIFHHALTLGLSNNDNIKKMPVWFIEGTAQYTAEWLAREKGYGFNSDSFSSHMDAVWVRARDLYVASSNNRLIRGERYGNGYYIDSIAQWGIAYMIEKSATRSGVASAAVAARDVIVTLPSQVQEKGWAQAFQDNVGMSLADFYTAFDAALSANAKSTRVAALVTANVATTIAPKYNYSVLQLTGATAGSTSGGSAESTINTVYYYDSDSNSTASYSGSSWPYIKTTDSSVTKATGVTATVSVSSGAVLINNGSALRPIYQYGSDTALSKSGATSSGWNAVKPDGTPVSRTLIME